MQMRASKLLFLFKVNFLTHVLIGFLVYDIERDTEGLIFV